MKSVQEVRDDDTSDAVGEVRSDEEENELECNEIGEERVEKVEDEDDVDELDKIEIVEFPGEDKGRGGGVGRIRERRKFVTGGKDGNELPILEDERRSCLESGSD